MGEIARRWDELTDEQKAEELRQPVITRAFGKPRGKVDFIASFEDLVTSIRRKAMGLRSLEGRAALVDKTWRQLQTLAV